MRRAENPEPLSLLRYFKPSASVGAAREMSNQALDVVFWPFSEYADGEEELETAEEEDTALDDDAAEEEDPERAMAGGGSDSGLEDLRASIKSDRKRGQEQEKARKAKRRRRRAEADGMNLLDKRVTAVKLLGVVRCQSGCLLSARQD